MAEEFIFILILNMYFLSIQFTVHFSVVTHTLNKTRGIEKLNSAGVAERGPPGWGPEAGTSKALWLSELSYVVKL
jgi:hypothetical protein